MQEIIIFFICRTYFPAAIGNKPRKDEKWPKIFSKYDRMHNRVWMRVRAHMRTCTDKKYHIIFGCFWMSVHAYACVHASLSVCACVRVCACLCLCMHGRCASCIVSLHIIQAHLFCQTPNPQHPNAFGHATRALQQAVVATHGHPALPAPAAGNQHAALHPAARLPGTPPTTLPPGHRQVAGLSLTRANNNHNADPVLHQTQTKLQL